MRNLLKEIESTIEKKGLIDINEEYAILEIDKLSEELEIDRYTLETIASSLYWIEDWNGTEMIKISIM